MKKIKWGKLDHDVWPVPTEEDRKNLLKALKEAKKLKIFAYHENENRFVIIDD